MVDDSTASGEFIAVARVECIFRGVKKYDDIYIYHRETKPTNTPYRSGRAKKGDSLFLARPLRRRHC